MNTTMLDLAEFAAAGVQEARQLREMLERDGAYCLEARYVEAHLVGLARKLLDMAKAEAAINRAAKPWGEQ